MSQLPYHLVSDSSILSTVRRHHQSAMANDDVDTVAAAGAANTLVTVQQLDAVVDKIISKDSKLGAKIESERSTHKHEAARLASSINNVQTQLLERLG